MLRIWNHLIGAAIGLGALAASTIIAAAPFAILYNGTVSTSSFPEIFPGQTFSVTLVVDNGGSSAANQTWTAANLGCVIFRMNTSTGAGGGEPTLVTFTQNLAATNGTLFVVGSMTTGPAGALTANFSDIETNSSPPTGTFSASGFTPVADIIWFLNSANPVFFDHHQFSAPTQRQFSDASGGVQMAIGNWSNPFAFSGTCPTGSTTTRSTTAVPTLTESMTMALALLLGISGFALMRRRS